jgi:DNA-binding NarL/FixJ family response regulator
MSSPKNSPKLSKRFITNHLEVAHQIHIGIAQELLAIIYSMDHFLGDPKTDLHARTQVRRIRFAANDLLKRIYSELYELRMPIVEPVSISATDLSPREVQLLGILPTGKSNEEIALELMVSVATIKTHLSGLYRKLDVKNRTQAISVARHRGLIG